MYTETQLRILEQLEEYFRSTAPEKIAEEVRAITILKIDGPPAQSYFYALEEDSYQFEVEKLNKMEEFPYKRDKINFRQKALSSIKLNKTNDYNTLIRSHHRKSPRIIELSDIKLGIYNAYNNPVELSLLTDIGYFFFQMTKRVIDTEKESSPYTKFEKHVA